jgi:WS/DGAT/MGAT family acyltransferase
MRIAPRERTGTRMKKLSLADKGFLLTERRETPMNVGGVSLYTLPRGANERRFLHDLARNVRDADTLLPPFGDRLRTGRLGLAGDVFWEPDPALDLDYHVRHSALPRPGRYRELFALVSHLHSTLLDRSRPLWEMHIIEGLQNRQFAVYTKSHHAAVDGMRSIHISRSMLSADPDTVLSESPLSLHAWKEYRKTLPSRQHEGYSDRELLHVADLLKSTFDSSAHMLGALRALTAALVGRSSDLSLPHVHVPTTSLNGRIDGARRFVAQSWPFDRIHDLGKAYSGTFNDAVLAMCAGALRRYLQNHSELPAESLKSMVPVSIRKEGDLDSGNAIAFISVDLGTQITDPVKRFRAIQKSVQTGKAFFKDMTPKEAELVSLIMQLPTIALMSLGLISRLPPYNLAISNVPGIQRQMYWNGARLDGTYPLSIVTDGMAMNITLVTNNDSVDFGIIACRRSTPYAQRLIDYMEESLQELEDAAGIAPAATRRKAGARRGAQRRPAAKKKLPKAPARKAGAAAARRGTAAR